MQTESNSSSKITAASLLVALGIIYGDIGTSPLYVLKAIVGEKPISTLLVYGGISLVFWTLCIQTTFKYIYLTLRADNHGEGGVFSLYALVRRRGKWLAIPAIIGATTLLADGILTPPISVASAVEGLTNLPGLEHTPTVPIVIAILSGLFFIQRYGTHKVGKSFGPAMLLWFSMLFILGLVHVMKHPEVLKALNPWYGIQFLRNYPNAFWLLGAVFLATTGAEALYSDLGHCGIKNIRITWIFVKIALITNYAGQAAWLLSNGEGSLLNGRNPFYELMPEAFLPLGIGIATMATIIASQAMISGSYTLVNEAINLNFWPRVAVQQPTELKGQIYIPSLNLMLWIGCVLMILYFQNSTHMEAAYGFSITITMLMTTLLLAYFLRYRLRWSLWLVIPMLLFLATVESAFFIANVAKIRERWMFLFFELGIFLTMYIWYRARKIINKHTHFTEIGKYSSRLIQLKNDVEIPLLGTHLIYLTKANNRHEIEEKIIHSIFARKPKRALHYWFVHIHRTEEPYTLEYTVSELIQNTLIKINIHVGFRIQPLTERYFIQILKECCAQNQWQLKTPSYAAECYQELPDFQFILIEKYLSVENQLALPQSLILQGYFQLRKFGQRDEKAFGIDKSDVHVEYVPLLHQAVPNFHLKRIESESNPIVP